VVQRRAAKRSFTHAEQARKKKILIFIVAYNAETTIAQGVQRIPRRFLPTITRS